MEQNQNNAAKIAALVRSGAINSAELPTLKVAMKKLEKVGDIAKLPKSHRLVLQKFYRATSDAAMASQQSLSAVRRNIMADVEITRDDFLSEEVSGDPPPMLVLKRKGIRMFPDGKRVALYTNDKLGVSFTVPYTSNGPEKDIVGVSEGYYKDIATEKEEDERLSNLEHVKNIVKDKKAKTLNFKDQTSTKVDADTANMVHNLHKKVNDENKARIEKMLDHSKEHFNKVLDFAKKNIK